MRTLSAMILVGCGVVPEERLPPCEVPGAICTWYGVPGEAGASTDQGVHRLEAWLDLPRDLAFGPDGAMFVADYANHRIQRVDPDGKVATVAGTTFLGDGPNTHPDADCWSGCDAATHAFSFPTAAHPDPLDPHVLWVAANRNSRIVRIDLREGVATWWAGTGGRFYGAGDRREAILDLPVDLAVDPATGALYFTDQGNHLVRRIDPDGAVFDVAGTPRLPGFAGDGGPAIDALLHGNVDRRSEPMAGLALAEGELYVVDGANGVVRAIDLDSGDIRTVAGRRDPAGTGEYTDPETGDLVTVDLGSIPGHDGDEGPATEVLLARPSDVAVGPGGELYVADTWNHCVRVVHPDTGWLSTVAGRCTEAGFGGDRGPATEALLDRPTGVAVDADGNLYVADSNNHVIRRIRAPAAARGAGPGDDDVPGTVPAPGSSAR